MHQSLRPGPSRATHQAASTEQALRVHDEKLWRAIVLHMADNFVPLHRKTQHDLAVLLERQASACHEPLSAAEILQMIEDGTGEIVVSRSAVAFAVDHGPTAGIELRCLYVMPSRRRCGAGQALIARLRARYVHSKFFCTYQDPHWTRFARLAGFEPREHRNGHWQVSSAPAALDEDPALISPSLALGSPFTPSRPMDEPGKIAKFIKAVAASAAVAVASASCIEL